MLHLKEGQMRTTRGDMDSNQGHLGGMPLTTTTSSSRHGGHKQRLIEEKLPASGESPVLGKTKTPPAAEMPKCVVTKCPHQTGKKARYPEIVLHPFPKDIKLIQEWLRLAGMEEENLELVSFEILEDRRSDKFRMCSAHFTKDCYISKGTKCVLKADAMPSKFPEKTVLDFAQPPMMHRIAKRARIEQSLTRTSSTRKAECSCKCHKRLNKARLVNASTQTELFDSLLPALVQQDFTAEEATDRGMASPLDMTTIKHWERTEFQIKQEETQSEYGFLSLKDTSADGYLKEKPTIACNAPSFNIITVDSWEAIKAHTEQEYNPNENGLLHSEDILQKNTNDGAFLHNGKDLVTAIKKEDDVNGYSHPEETDANMDETLLDKPICSTTSPGERPTRNRKSNRVRLRKVNPCNENGHLPDQSSILPTDVSTQPQQKQETNTDVDTSRPTKSKCSKSHPTEELLEEETYAEEKQYVVYESCLDVLLVNMRCRHDRCSARIKEFDKQMVGSLLVVYGTCCQGHHGKLWESRPRVNGFGARNVLLAALLVLTGLNVTKIKELCDIIAQQMYSESSIHRYEDVFISQRIINGMEEESTMADETAQEDISWDRGRTV